jgi:uncharacterized iron-regulated membrane protein
VQEQLLRPIKAQRRPWLPPKFVQAVLAGHSALGLAFATLIYLVCLSGTLSVFLLEYHRWEQPNAPIVRGPLTDDAINEATWAGHGQALIDGAAQDLILTAPTATFPRFGVFYFNALNHREGEWIADADGKLRLREEAPWSEFIGDLHTQLHLPRTLGAFIVGLIGVALLSSLISGLLAHPRIFKDAFAFRWGGSKRLQEADLHNRLGVWGLPFHFVVTLTGALLGLATLIMGVLALAAYNGDSQKAYSEILGPRGVATGKPGPVPDVRPMIAKVRAMKPDAELVRIHFQHIATSGQMVHVHMRTPGHLAFYNSYYFDADGKYLGEGGMEEGGVGQQIVGVLQPLHYGWFGGLGTKIIYAVLGLALTIVTQTGVTIWLARRRDKGRPAERWERIWTAVVWGQPAALALTAFASLYLPERLVAIYLIATGASLIATARVSDGRTIRSVLIALSSVALVITSIIHFARWRATATDTGILWMDAVLLIGGLSLASFLAIGRPLRSSAILAAKS